MTIEQIISFLEKHAEPEYAAFSASLLNDTITVRGVRLPLLRKFARQLVKEGVWLRLWEEDTDRSFEMILLKGLTLAGAKLPEEERWEYIARYVPLITNWALCDSVCTSLRFVRREPESAWQRLQPYWLSDREFAQRFAVVMLLDHFLTSDYIERVLEVLTSLQPAGYYAAVAVAWALSVAFVDFPERVYALLQSGCLSDEMQRMTLRKIIESRRVSDSWKECIRALRS